MTAARQFALDFSGKCPAKVQERIADGMERADSHADPKWRHIFDACVLAAAKKHPEITSDDVLAEIEALPDPPNTHNLAAIGPAMQRAARMGIITATTGVLRSKRPEKNGNLQRIWRSNYYVAPAVQQKSAL